MPTKSNGKASHHSSGQKSRSRAGKSSQRPHGRGGHEHSKSQSGSGHSSRGSKSSSTSGRSASKSNGGSAQSSTQGLGAKLGKSIKEHPIVTAALGAGAGLLIFEGVRRAVRGGSSGTSGGPEKSQRDSDESQSESEPQGSSRGEADDDDSSEEEYADEDDEEDEPVARGRDPDKNAQGNSSGWGAYPLLISAGALGLGAAAGYLLPGSVLEDKAMGQASDKLTGKLKSASESFADFASEAYDKAADTARDEAERMGITPKRLTQKVKRLAGKVRDAVSESVQK